MKRVRELMHPGLITCPPDTKLGQVAVLLNRHSIHAIVVSEPGGQPLGILSDIDLLAGEWLSADSTSLDAMRAITAGQLMTRPAQSIDADSTSDKAIGRMRSQQIHRLLVAEGGQVVGVISVSDLIASFAGLRGPRRTAREVMSRGLVVCLEDTPLWQAARAMMERHSRSVVVVDAHGAPRGIVTGWDLLCAQAERTENVAGLMHAPVTIYPEASLREVADKMIQHHIHRLLVVDPAKPDSMPLGLISTSDIVAEMAEPGSVWQS